MKYNTGLMVGVFFVMTFLQNHFIAETAECVEVVAQFLQLRVEIGGPVVECASLVVEDNLGVAGHRKLMDEVINSLPRLVLQN